VPCFHAIQKIGTFTFKSAANPVNVGSGGKQASSRLR